MMISPNGAEPLSTVGGKKRESLRNRRALARISMMLGAETAHLAPA